MALVRKISDESRPFLLKDYLMDDMSFSSSNGFKSYPRRHCCTTVRFLMDIDLRSKPPAKAVLRRNRTKSAASVTVTALQRASVAVLNAVKSSKGRLPRSFSKKLLKRGFWKKNKEEPDRRFRLFGELLMEKEEPSDEITQHSSTSTDSTTVTTSSDSFDDIGFSPDTIQSTNTYDVVEGKTDFLPEKVNKRVGVTDGEDSTESETTTSSVQNAEIWQNHEEKEQFSPVSVLDCPFEDEEEEESGSQFQRSVARVVEGGTKQKMRRFEGVNQLEPTNLEKRIALSEQHPKGQLESPMQQRTIISTNAKVNEYEENETEKELEELLEQVKVATCPTSNGDLKFVADILLLDFFRESVVEDKALSEKESLTLAIDWVNGKTRESVLGWEVKEGREMYIRHMEKGGEWRKTASFQEEVAVQLEGEIWASLVNDVLVDLC